MSDPTRSPASRFLQNHLLAVAAIVVLIVGCAGNLMKNLSTVPVESASHALKLFLDSVLQSLQLFTLTARPAPGEDNWLLVLARLGGALVAFKAIGSILLGVVALTRKQRRLAGLRGHTLLCGYGERGRLFAGAARTPLCVVDIADGVADEASASSRVKGDARDPSVLQAAGLARADTLVIGTGSDERNLGIARTALDGLSEQNPRPLRMIVTLDDPMLTDTIEREEAIVRPAVKARPVTVTLFNPARAAAQSLLQKPVWARRALAAGNPRIALAIVGASDTAIEVLLQFLRVSPCCGLGKPKVDLFAPAARLRDRLLARAPNLIHVLDVAQHAQTSDAPLHWAVDLAIHDFDPAHAPVASLLAAAPRGGADGWTAMVVAAASSTENIALALGIRQEMRRQALPPCPIHVHAPTLTSLEPLLEAQSAEQGTGVQAFGRLGELCVLDPESAPRERLARQIHDAYRQRRLADASRAVDAGDVSLRDWSDLPETYRRSNRRAADHLRTKWLSANALAGHALDACGFPDALTPQLLEALSAIEHDSWRIDRELDGWRYAAERDNARLRHPDLIPYVQLKESIKDYDREQIRELWPFKPD